jgi:hypothetical protein
MLMRTLELALRTILWVLAIGAGASIGTCSGFVSTHGGWVTVIPELLK